MIARLLAYLRGPDVDDPLLGIVCGVLLLVAVVALSFVVGPEAGR